jgi:shikimate 5-dehydrogenase
MFGKNEKKNPIKELILKHINVVYDLTVNPNKNNLQKLCEKYKIEYFSGIYSSYLQGIRQFEIYNNIKLSKKILNKIYK